MECVSDLVGHLLELDAPASDIVVVEEHPDFPGELTFQVFKDESEFHSRYSEWLSPHLVLNELFSLKSFADLLQRDGYNLIFGPSCESILSDYERWTEELKVENFSLYPFQQFSLRRASEQSHWFFNWSTGTGKSFTAAVGASWMIDQGVDVVVVCTVSAFKQDMCDFFVQAGIDAVVNDGTKAQRLQGYADAHKAYVCNYEKLWVDQQEWETLLAGKRVLFIMDEVQKIISDGAKNKSRKALEQLWRIVDRSSHLWMMSATVVNGNPLRYRDVFSIGRPVTNPLGSKTGFEKRYAKTARKYTVRPSGYYGRSFQISKHEWDLNKLTDVRHRVGSHTHAVRKTDPGIIEQFKDMPTIIERIHPSDQEKALSSAIIQLARRAGESDDPLAGYYNLLRVTANTPLSLLYTTSPAAEGLLQKFNVKKMACSKLEVLNEQLSAIRDQGDKVLVFTKWTNLTLKILDPMIEVPHVVHYGTGQSAQASTEARDRFRNDPDITCFFTSDAGKEGLSMQCARYVIQYEPTYSYDDGIQRASRIHRADSYLDGLTNYVYCLDNSIEEKVLRINNLRRIISESVQGTVEALSDSDRKLASRNEQQNMNYLVFGGS